MTGDLYSYTYNPDVLSCLANLSNDEVFTPPALVNQMLDLLPQSLWSDPSATFLDPACKSGVFLREIAKRLLEGLKDQIPDLQTRIDHIFQKQLYGIAITELTSLLSRRSLYCSKYPNSRYSITPFTEPAGNIKYHRIEHAWRNGRCASCGASQSEYDRGPELETHSYEFIHIAHLEELFNMKFDVIIGNPPYHLSDGGAGASARPIYHMFIEQAKKLQPRYLVMITPSRWFAGGKGLDAFRKEMIFDKRIRQIIDYANAKECFPGISLGGGVNYFLWDRDNPGDCEITNVLNNNRSTRIRNLNEFPIFIRSNEAIDIIHKIRTYSEESLSSTVSSRNPFGFPSYHRGSEKSDSRQIKIYSSGASGFVSYDEVTQGKELLNLHKLMVSKLISEHAGEPDKNGMFKVLSKTLLLKPQEVCTDSYLIVYTSKKYLEVENCFKYLCTRFARFLLLQAITSINLSKDKFIFVPLQDFSKPWNDENLYAKYKLTTEEIAYIESTIRPWD